MVNSQENNWSAMNGAENRQLGNNDKGKKLGQKFV